MRRFFLLLSAPVIAAACGSSSNRGVGTMVDASTDDGAQADATAPDTNDDVTVPTPTWTVAVDTSTPGRTLSPALLGHYDLAGSLWHYDQVPGLVSAMHAVGLPEWRVSVERWEGRSEMFPATTTGTSCAYPEPSVFVPSGWTDFDLMRARDWFIDDGQPVTMAMTQDDGRYALDYARSVLDVAAAFGADPFVSLDAMPLALSRGRTPSRSQCYWSFQNRVTDAPPADPNVFAAAVVGLVQRIVLGSGGQPGRKVTHFEVWNEPEGFWDHGFDPDLSIFWTTAQTTLQALAAFRTQSGHPELRFGFAGFAMASTAVQALQKFDALGVPLDFVSFHSYATDPLAIVQNVESVMSAVRATTHYQNIEVALTEWGPGFDIEHNDESRLNPDLAYAASIDPALHAATVIARSATAGLTRAHHVFFWDFFPFRIRGLLQNDLSPRPQYYAFKLLAQTIGDGARLLPATGATDTQIVLATLDQGGHAHVLLVNRDTSSQVVRVTLGGVGATPAHASIYDDPGGVIRDGQSTGGTTLVPAKSIVLLDL